MAGAEPSSGPELPRETRLKDLRVTDAPVAITARVVRAERREIQRRTDGDRRKILSGTLTDGTATVRFTWWDPPAEEIDPGLVIRAAPVQVREFQGKPELSFGWRTRVAPASEHELPDVDPREVPLVRAGDIGRTEPPFRLEVEVIECRAKSVTVGTERRQIHDGLLADASGLVAFTAWTDFRLRAGESIRLLGAYPRSFRGRPQVVLDEGSRVERIEKVASAPPGELGLEVMAIGLALDRGAAERRTVRGRALAVQPPSGLVFRCPACERITREGSCRVHGPVEGHPDLRLRLILDDGTGCVTLNLDRDQVEELTGATLASTLDLARQHPDPSAIGFRWLTGLFGRSFRARGPVAIDEFGASMYPTEVVPDEPVVRPADLTERWRRFAP